MCHQLFISCHQLSISCHQLPSVDRYQTDIGLLGDRETRVQAAFDCVGSVFAACHRSGGMCLLMGDLNAQCGELDDRPYGSLPHIAARVAPGLGPVNARARMLVEWAVGSGMLLATGRAPGDVPAAASTMGRRHADARRPDHAFITCSPM